MSNTVGLRPHEERILKAMIGLARDVRPPSHVLTRRRVKDQSGTGKSTQVAALAADR